MREVDAKKVKKVQLLVNLRVKRVTHQRGTIFEAPLADWLLAELIQQTRNVKVLDMPSKRISLRKKTAE